MKYIYLYLITLLAFLVVDVIWLTVISKNLYSNSIGHLMAENPKLLPAAIFYLIFVVGVIIFAVLPGYQDSSLIKTILLAALFGGLSYATYDLTNLATLKDWPVHITVIDIIWGASLSTLTSVAGYYAASWIGI
jgi:uncharacterized membrane protein